MSTSKFQEDLYIIKLLSVILNISMRNIFCFEKYIGSQNEIKLLHSFKGQLK